MAITGRNRDQVERCAKSLMDMLIYGSDIVPTVKDILRIENHIRIIFEQTNSYQLSLVHEAVESAFEEYADLQKEKDKFSDRINNALATGIIETGGTDSDSKNERLKAKILSYFCSHRNF